MSVVGFDVGCQLSKVAVAHRKKISVVPNELTKLLTPTLTAFGERERTFGDGALTQYNRNYKNTIAQLKRWLGRKANDPKIQQEAAFWLPGVTTGALPDGRFAINVVTSQGQMLLAPEQILSGFFGQLKKVKIFFIIIFIHCDFALFLSLFYIIYKSSNESTKNVLCSVII